MSMIHEGQRYRKTFSDAKFGGADNALLTAKAWRDVVFSSFKHENGHDAASRGHVHNTSGATGVSRARQVTKSGMSEYGVAKATTTKGRPSKTKKLDCGVGPAQPTAWLWQPVNCSWLHSMARGRDCIALRENGSAKLGLKQILALRFRADSSQGCRPHRSRCAHQAAIRTRPPTSCNMHQHLPSPRRRGRHPLLVAREHEGRNSAKTGHFIESGIENTYLPDRPHQLPLRTHRLSCAGYHAASAA